MKKATFHMIAGVLAVGLMFGVNFAQAQAGTLDTNLRQGWHGNDHLWRNHLTDRRGPACQRRHRGALPVRLRVGLWHSDWFDALHRSRQAG